METTIPKCKCDKFFASRGMHFNGCKYYQYCWEQRRNAKLRVMPEIGIMLRWQSFWVGLHYSKSCKRLCINLLPCITIWLVFAGGVRPDKKKM